MHNGNSVVEIYPLFLKRVLINMLKSGTINKEIFFTALWKKTCGNPVFIHILCETVDKFVDNLIYGGRTWKH